MVDNPSTTEQHSPLYKLRNQGPFFINVPTNSKTVELGALLSCFLSHSYYKHERLHLEIVLVTLDIYIYII